MEQEEKIIANLAAKLFDNHKLNRIFGNNGVIPSDVQNQKTVFVIGAGASHAAAGLPLGKELAAELVNKLDCKSGEGRKQFDYWLNYMKQTYGFDKDDFKTILFSLNQIDSETLVDLVQSALLNKFSKNFLYESIASLLRERQIDAIINFNFDEILDNHLQEEFLGQEKYLNIYSDKTCPSDLSGITSKYNRFHVPVYIKPHGTISDRESLRFTRKDFYRIEPLQKQLIENLLSHTPVNLIVVGFRLKFFEFSKLIEKCLLPGSQIFLIDKCEDILDSHILKFYKGNFLQVTDATSLDVVMYNLSKALQELMSVKGIESIQEDFQYDHTENSIHIGVLH